MPQNVNEIIAKKLLEERSKDYQNARRVAKDYEATTRGLVRGAPATPPLNNAEETQQIDMWKKLVRGLREYGILMGKCGVLMGKCGILLEKCLKFMGK